MLTQAAGCERLRETGRAGRRRVGGSARCVAIRRGVTMRLRRPSANGCKRAAGGAGLLRRRFPALPAHAAGQGRIAPRLSPPPYFIPSGLPRYTVRSQKLEMGRAKIENGERKVPTLGIEGGVVGDCGEAPAHGDVLGGCRRGAIPGLFPTFYSGGRGYDSEAHRVCSKLNSG